MTLVLVKISWIPSRYKNPSRNPLDRLILHFMQGVFFKTASLASDQARGANSTTNQDRTVTSASTLSINLVSV